jgi:hypothetical protein
MNLLDQRCSNHSLREAAVQCPSCKRYFCRECVTEHQGRMICVSCVTTSIATQPGAAFKPGWILTSAAGLLIAWLIFYYLGQSLARIPSEFHAYSPIAAPPSGAGYQPAAAYQAALL